MIRPHYFIFIVLFTGCIFGLLQIKFKVQNLHQETIELKQQLSREKSLIHVLKAEWAYLNDPRRLLYLSEKFLDLSELKPEQILLSDLSTATIASNKLATKNSALIKASYKSEKNVKWHYKERPDPRVRK